MSYTESDIVRFFFFFNVQSQSVRKKVYKIRPRNVFLHIFTIQLNVKALQTVNLNLVYAEKKKEFYTAMTKIGKVRIIIANAGQKRFIMIFGLPND